MEEFKKPNRIFVSDKEYIEKLVNANLIKDLHDNEELCSFCHGTGMMIRDNVYGLSEDPDNHGGIRFPYKHQALSYCPHCYNGIIYRCKYCGQLIYNGHSSHNCKPKLDEMQREARAKEAQRLADAPLAPPAVLEKSYFLYSDCYGKNEGYFNEWEEFFEEWRDSEGFNPEKPEFVWATEPLEMNLDAVSIVESATEDLYDDAYNDISTDSIKKLQVMLDKWCKEYGPSPTYVPSRFKVRIPWEDYEKYA